MIRAWMEEEEESIKSLEEEEESIQSLEDENIQPALLQHTIKERINQSCHVSSSS
jgi:hypothetical protein